MQKFPVSRFRDYATNNIRKIDEFFANPYQVGDNVLISYSWQFRRARRGEIDWYPTTVSEVADNCCYKVTIGDGSSEWVRLDQIKSGPDSEE